MLSKVEASLEAVQDVGQSTQCGCSSAVGTKLEIESRPVAVEPNLEDLIPIALVIAAGCEPCAEKMVSRALEQGSTPRHIQKTLQIIAKMQKLDCFAGAVGPEAVARMERPLIAGQRTLQEAVRGAGK